MAKVIIYDAIDNCPIWNFEKAKSDVRYLLKLDSYSNLPDKADSKQLTSAFNKIISEMQTGWVSVSVLRKKLAAQQGLNSYLRSPNAMLRNQINRDLASLQIEIDESIDYLMITENLVRSLFSIGHQNFAEHLKKLIGKPYKSIREITYGFRKELNVNDVFLGLYDFIDLVECEPKKQGSLMEQIINMELILKTQIDPHVCTIEKFYLLRSMAQERAKATNKQTQK